MFPLPDDFVHAGVGEERLIKLVVAPLSVAQQVHYYILAELALVLDSQPCGTDNFFRVIPIHVDNCASDNFTCPGIQNITTVITSTSSKENKHPPTVLKTTNNSCEVYLTKTNLQQMLSVMRAGVRSRSLPQEKGQLTQPVVFVTV